MLRSAALLTVFGFAAACVDPTLVPFDGGVDDVDLDAGSVRDAGSLDPDGGPVDRDAGQPADGGVDAGFGPFPTDAGPPPPVCIFPVTPIEPFVCEGDEDFCDVEGDVNLSHADILGVWSHVEGDEFVIDVRFADMPFRAPMYTSLLLDPSPFPTLGAGWEFVLGPPYQPPTVFGSMVFHLGGDAVRFPPGAGFHPLDIRPEVCTLVRLGVFAPMLQFRLPVVGSIRYLPGSWLLEPSAPFDVPLMPSNAELISSNGGQPDGDNLYESICNITCESIGGTTQ